jgi:hypothetical protein
MITAPVAVLIARFGRYVSLLSSPSYPPIPPIAAPLTTRRNRNKFKWLPSHRALQCGTLLLVLVGYACAIAGNRMRGGKSLQDRHAVGSFIHSLCSLDYGLLWVMPGGGSWSMRGDDMRGLKVLEVAVLWSWTAVPGERLRDEASGSGGSS